jgi:phage gp29-like protein
MMWFRTMLDHALDSIYWGYSLVAVPNLSKVNGWPVEPTLVERDNVRPEYGLMTPMVMGLEGYPYFEGEYYKWAYPFGDVKDLGLFRKVVPYIVWKRFAFGQNANVLQTFGLPTRVGKTSVSDDTLRSNMSRMLAQMSQAGWAVMDSNDEIEVIGAVMGTGLSDSFKGFIKDLCNSEVSKLIVGQTMTMDEGASRSQSETHSDTFESIIKADCKKIEGWVNNVIIPRLYALGCPFGIGIEDIEFRFNNSEKVTLEAKFNMVKGLLDSGASIAPAWIMDTFGVPVDSFSTPQVNTPQAGGLGVGKL